jgi:hypothetical protein
VIFSTICYLLLAGGASVFDNIYILLRVASRQWQNHLHQLPRLILAADFSCAFWLKIAGVRDQVS